MVKVGDWYGSCELMVIPLDDFRVILGLDFMRKGKVSVIPYLDGLMIHDEYATCFVHVSQDRDETAALTTLQLRDSLRRGEATYVATIREEVMPMVGHAALPTEVTSGVATAT